MKNFKRLFLLLLSFFIPFLIFFIVFYIKGYYTDKLILTSDLRAQYYPLFSYFKDILSGTGSLFYSFNKGVGGTMFGTIFYYMSSPLNLLLIFVSKSNIISFITFLIILKLSLCGLTMFIYLSKKFNCCNSRILVFSICYALMGYNINYYTNVMWFDVVFLAPLVLLGIDYIIRKNSPIFYSIVLFISIISNYYISYMLCVFCLLYFLYEVFINYDYKSDKKIIFNKIKVFIISSLLVGLTCSFFIIPCIFESTNYGRFISFDKIFTFSYNFFDLFSKSYIGSLKLNDLLNYTSMNLYCSEFFLVVLFLYFFGKSENSKKKKLSVLFILIMIIPVFVGLFNWIWHLFTVPSYLSYRYSFLLCLFIIRLCYDELDNIVFNKNSVALFLSIYLIISFYLIIITNGGNYYDFLNYKLILLSILFVLVYLVLLYFGKKKKIFNKIILVVIVFELILNVGIIFSTSKPVDRALIDSYIGPMNEFSSYSDINHRIETTFFETMNESLLYGYNGVGSFLSTTNYRILYFEYYVGNGELITYPNDYSYQKQNYILDSLLSIRYMLYPYKVNNYELVDSYKFGNTDAYLYRNDNVYGYGYVIKNKCNNLGFDNFYDNKIYNCLFDTDVSFYNKIDYVEKNDDSLKYKVNKGDYVYIYIKGASEDEIDEFKKYNSSNFEKIVYSSSNIEYVAVQALSSSLYISIPDDFDFNRIEVYTFDFDNFIDQKKPTSLSVTSVKKNFFEAEIDLNSDEVVMVTLPYEKGFIIKIDGNPVHYYEVADAFIGFDVSVGHHSISIQYRQPGLILGAIISVLSITLNIIFTYKIYSYNNKENNK